MSSSDTHSAPNYTGLVLDLIGMAFLLLVPKTWINESNWRLSYLFLLIGGWGFMAHYFFKLKSLTAAHEIKMKWWLTAISVVIVGFLIVGTIRFFTQPHLQQVTGPCVLSAKTIQDNSTFELHIRGPQKIEKFKITQETFSSLVRADQYFVVSARAIDYPCQNDTVTATYIPHFHFLISAE